MLPLLGPCSLLISDRLLPSGESPVPSKCPSVSAEWYVCLSGHTFTRLTLEEIVLSLSLLSPSRHFKCLIECIVMWIDHHTGGIAGACGESLPTALGWQPFLAQVWTEQGVNSPLPASPLASVIPSPMVSRASWELSLC